MKCIKTDKHETDWHGDDKWSTCDFCWFIFCCMLPIVVLAGIFFLNHIFTSANNKVGITQNQQVTTEHKDFIIINGKKYILLEEK